jgi:hypothetical protein
MTTHTGTHHFTSERAALAYYNTHEGGGYKLADIRAKIAEAAIVIGPPKFKADGSEARYAQQGRFYIIRADRPAEGTERRYTLKKFRQSRGGRVVDRGLTRVEAEAKCHGDKSAGPGWFYGWTVRE